MRLLHQISVPILIMLAGFLCLEFAVPIALGEFFAGILGGLFFDVEHIPWLSFFSHLGVLSIMFLAGFEMDAKVLKANLKANLFVGLLSFFLPFTTIFLVALVAGIEHSQAVILGIALSTTSLAIVFSVLHDATRIRPGEKQLLLGSAMVVDMLSVALFTVVFVELSWDNLVFTLILVALMLIARVIVRPIFRRYKGSRYEFELKFLLLILLCLGFLADRVGIHAAVIAFILGVMLSGVSAEHEEINAKLSTVVFSLLAPIFFFYSGVLIKFEHFNLQSLILFVLVCSAAIGMKYLGTYLGMLIFHKPHRQLARYAGLIFNYRLSFGIVTAVAAYEQRAISAEVFNVALLGIAASAVFTIILEKRLERKLRKEAAD